MPDPLGAGVGGAHPRTRRPAGLFALPADRGPVPPGSRLQVQRPELIDAEDHFRIAVLRGRFPVVRWYTAPRPGPSSPRSPGPWRLSRFSGAERWRLPLGAGPAGPRG